MLRGATDYTVLRGHLKHKKNEKKYLHELEYHSKLSIIGFNMVNKPFQIYNISLNRTSQAFQQKNSYNYVRYSLNYHKCRISKTSCIMC